MYDSLWNSVVSTGEDYLIAGLNFARITRNGSCSHFLPNFLFFYIGKLKDLCGKYSLFGTNTWFSYWKLAYFVYIPSFRKFYSNVILTLPTFSLEMHINMPAKMTFSFQMAILFKELWNFSFLIPRILETRDTDSWKYWKHFRKKAGREIWTIAHQMINVMVFNINFAKSAICLK